MAQDLLRPVHGLVAVPEELDEAVLKGLAVGVDAEMVEDPGPADGPETGAGQVPLLDLPPEGVVDPAEDGEHPLRPGDAQLRKALADGSLRAAVKVQKGVVDVDENGSDHGDLLAAMMLPSIIRDADGRRKGRYGAGFTRQ